MAQTNDNSDLLILSEEDSNIDTLMLDDTIILDDDLSTASNEQDSELITFDDMSMDFGIDTKTEKVNNNIDDSLDLSSFGSENVTNSTPENIDNTLSNLSFDLSENTDVIVESTPIVDNGSSNIDFTTINASETINSMSNVGTMVSILEKAINELETRTDVIVLEITTEEKNISELKDKIAKLESEVLVSENKVTELTDEKTMISKNIKSLDKMKQIEHATQKKAA
ncbi:MAG: hypothetical protein Q8K30_06515 [Candidatus Gracilibacteria bacterium]|nr:hypothetical protein [Candidatus Gracilibacteria bacterium]